MRPRHAFAAVLMATSLVAVAIPAYAAVGTTPDPADVASTIPGVGDIVPQPADSSTAPAATTSSTAPAATTSSSAPAASTSSSAPAAGNPVTDLATCLQAAGLDPAKAQTCFTAAAAGLQGLIPGGGSGTPNPTVALTTFFTCAQAALTAKSTAAGEKCGTDLFAALGIKQAQCLDPTLQPLLSAIDGLLAGDPTKLQATLTDLPNTLPGQLQQLPACLQGSTPDPTPTPTPTATASTGTTATSAPASSDPIAAVAVAAEPTFTG